ncbi:M15 family metallopeptidase [Priestia filamentosa]|uniref:M15 family metallopeptidase n=1 Tax=Priestia filamentosa TaxID=1402861 RepID=UPI00397C25D1
MRKRTWTVIIATIGILLLLELSFILWGRSKTTTDAYKISSLHKSITGCEIIPKSFSLSNKTSQQGKNNSDKTSDVSFPSYEETIRAEEDSISVVNNPTSVLVMVNKQRKLPDNYIPPKLVIPNVRFSFNEIVEKRYLREVAAVPLEKMFKQAEEEGYILYGVSGYRSYNRQIAVFKMHEQELGEEKAREVSSVPGSSEHQTGLSIDISSESAKFLLSTEFGSTPEGKWVKENAHKFGFIIRYPEDKTKITGYSFEPWHIRYVGIQHATYLYKHNLALEEAIK